MVVDHALLMRRLQFLTLVQKVARMDVEASIESVGIEALTFHSSATAIHRQAAPVLHRPPVAAYYEQHTTSSRREELPSQVRERPRPRGNECPPAQPHSAKSGGRVAAVRPDERDEGLVLSSPERTRSNKVRVGAPTGDVRREPQSNRVEHHDAGAGAERHHRQQKIPEALRVAPNPIVDERTDQRVPLDVLRIVGSLVREMRMTQQEDASQHMHTHTKESCGDVQGHGSHVRPTEVRNSTSPQHQSSQPSDPHCSVAVETDVAWPAVPHSHNTSAEHNSQHVHHTMRRRSSNNLLSPKKAKVAGHKMNRKDQNTTNPPGGGGVHNSSTHLITTTDEEDNRLGARSGNESIINHLLQSVDMMMEDLQPQSQKRQESTTGAPHRITQYPSADLNEDTEDEDVILGAAARSATRMIDEVDDIVERAVCPISAGGDATWPSAGVSRRGHIPSHVVERIMSSRNEAIDVHRYNERLYNTSSVSEHVFADRLVDLLLQDLIEEVLDEVDTFCDEYIDELATHELQ